MNFPTIIDSFDDDRDAIISPQQIVYGVRGGAPLPEIAVATFSGRSLSIAAEKFGARQIDTFNAGMEYPVFALEYKSKTLAFYFSPVGGASSAATLDEMAAKSVRKFVFYGSCGALNRELTEKSLIIPSEAYRDEGASYHYAPPSTYIKVQTSLRLAEILSQLGLPHVCGRTWTTDALYRETRKNTALRKADGCLTVEMECASIMAAAQFRGVECYQFLYAADSLDGVEWDSRTLGKLSEDDHESFLRIALEIATLV